MTFVCAMSYFILELLSNKLPYATGGIIGPKYGTLFANLEIVALVKKGLSLKMYFFVGFFHKIMSVSPKF